MERERVLFPSLIVNFSSGDLCLPRTNCTGIGYLPLKSIGSADGLTGGLIFGFWGGSKMLYPGFPPPKPMGICI